MSSDITDRHGQLADLNASIKYAIEQSGAFRNCLTCTWWSKAKTTGDANGPPHPEGCGKFQQTPPAEIIVKGCNDHTDTIPF